ncbi:YqaE/Pmp3 family membrane protein [Rhodotorula paludigena]
MARTSDILLILVAILFPPAAAGILSGVCAIDFWINLLLTLLGYIPGHIHAFWLIYRRMKADEMYGEGNWVYTGNAEYAPLDPQYAPHPHAHPHPHAVHGYQAVPQQQTRYGTA